jgi:hypothetical protein
VASIALGGRYPVTGRSRRSLARSWVYVPAAGGPIGAGLIKLGGGSTAWAVTVGVVPYAAAALILAPIAVGYFLALARYRRGKPADLEAGERLIKTLTCALIAILTLSRPEFPAVEPRPLRQPRKVRPMSGVRAPPQAGRTGLPERADAPRAATAAVQGRALAEGAAADGTGVAPQGDGAGGR